MTEWMFTLYWWPTGGDWDSGRDVSYGIEAESTEEAAETIFRDWHEGSWQSAALWTDRGLFWIDLDATEVNYSLLTD